MAHSSGGGSCGGGCHSSSSHSYSHYGRSNHIYSRHRFPGSRKYAYRDRNGDRRYIYSTQNPAEQKPVSILICLMYLIFLAFLIPNIHSAYFVPRAISNPQGEILIEDQLGILEDLDVLTDRLKAFYQETGVTPAVKTVPQEQWQGAYYDLEDYALQEYYNLFEDEKHWLIVYSAPVDQKGSVQTYRWKFEGIIGDDTAPSIDDNLCREFTEAAYDSLMDGENPAKAIGDSFQNLLAMRNGDFFAMNKHVLFAHGLMLSFCLIPLTTAIKALLNWKKYKDAVPAE